MQEGIVKPKINLVTSEWIPTIMKVENGYIISILTPNEDMNITETYVKSNWNEVVEFLADNFKLKE